MHFAFVRPAIRAHDIKCAMCRFTVIVCLIASACLTACGSKSTPEVSREESAAALPVTPVPAAPLNVVWILLDACRPDHLSSYGYHRPTSPNIDALAARGVLFERNYAQGPNTLLSVGSYMTGRHNPVFYQDARHLGIWFLREPPAGEQLLSSILKENGYQTAMFSASPWYSAESRLGKSFGEFHLLNYGGELPEESFEKRNAHVFNWIESHAKEKFFIYIHSLDTHEPRYHNNTKTTWLDPAFPRARDGELRRWKNGAFSPADQKHIVDLYDGGVAYADSSVGEICAALERLGIAENTIVVISADHGEILGQDGETVGHPQNSSVDDVLRTPLIIAGPGLPAGHRVFVRTENTDIVPTLVDLLRVTTSATFDGVSLRTTATAPKQSELHEYAYARAARFLIDADLDRVLIYDDVKFDLSAYDQQGIDFLHLAQRPQMIAYALPDTAGHRQEITPDPDFAAQVNKLSAEKLKPAWEAYNALPKTTPSYFETGTGGSVVPADVVSVLDLKDNLWTRQRSPYLFRISESDLLVADPSQEDPPALILGVNIPNGEYRVQAFTVSLPADGPPRGVSFKFSKYPEEGSTYREFGLPAPEPGKSVDGWIELGTYSVTQGNFVYSLETGRPEDLTVLGALRFTKVGEEGAAPDEDALKAEMERLESTGYANSTRKTP